MLAIDKIRELKAYERYSTSSRNILCDLLFVYYCYCCYCYYY